MQIKAQIAKVDLSEELGIKIAKPAEEKEIQKNDISGLVEAKADVDKEELSKSIEKLNETLHIYNKHLKFLIHKESGRVMVQVINNKTGEVVREIPPKKILDMLAKMQEFIGMLVDERI